MKNYGLVSVITPTWNCAQYIAQTIQSVQAQTYKNWEMIIVDDCSTDDTFSVVESYMHDDKRIKFFANPNNSGAAITRNAAIRQATGKWLAFLDSDDIWKPEKLEHQLKFMEENDLHFSYHEYVELDDNGNETGVSVSGPRHVSKVGMYAFCWPGCLTVMYDASVVGLLQIRDIKKNNDYAMWLKVIKKTDCYLLPEKLAMYRRGRTGSVSSHSILTMMKWHYKLFRFAEEKNQIASLWLTFWNMVFGLYKKIKYVKKYQLSHCK